MANTKKYVSFDKLSLYDEKIKKVISDGDAATLASAKEHAEGLGVNYDAAGSAATAEANAKAYADGKDAAIAEAKKAGTDAQAAAEVADGKAVEAKTAADNAQSDVNELKEYVGTIPEGATSTNVVAYVQEKTAGIATSENLQELTNRVVQAETDIDNIEKDYLKAADKTELSEAIATEKTRAEGIESGLRTDVDAIKADYLKASDKTELQGNIDTVAGAVERLTNGVSADEVDGVNDLIQYVKDHGTEVTGMQEDIAENAEAIAAEKERAEAEEAKNAQAAADAKTAADNAQAAADAEAERAKGVEGGLDTRLQAVEAQLGDGENSVAELIATAKQEAIDAAAQDASNKDAVILSEAQKYADAEDAKIEATVAELATTVGTKAAQADLEALSGRVTTAEGEIDTLQTEMDAVEALAAANKAAHEANAAAIALKASQADLTAVSDRVGVLETWHNNFTEVSEEEINSLFA